MGSMVWNEIVVRMIFQVCENIQSVVCMAFKLVSKSMNETSGETTRA